MTETYTYNATTISTIREGTVSFTQCAQTGQVGSGRVVIDDTAGTQSIIGQKDFSATQAFCSFTKTFNGYVADRIYSRGEYSPKTGAARSIDTQLQDQNAMLGFNLIHPYAGSTDLLAGIRPAETVAARMAWLMASPFVPFIDGGRIASSTRLMDATDYRNQYAGDVLADCALAAGGFNYYIRDFGSGAELVFRDDNTSSADTSTLRISNVLADASSVTIYPFKDFTLRRDPSNVYSVLGLNYAKGAAVLGRAATATAFNGQRGGVASNSNITTPAKALEEAASLLFQHSTEEDVLEGTVQLTAAQVNLIMHGDRISAKFSHYATEGYGSFTWFRVLERTVKPIVADGALYEVHLKLSPQEETCGISTLVIRQHADSTAETTGYADLPAVALAGSLILVRVEYDPTTPNTAMLMDGGLSSGYTRLANVFIDGDRNNGAAMFAKDATGGEQRIKRDLSVLATAHVCAYEITGATVADLETVSKTHQTSATNPKTLAAHTASVGLLFDLFIGIVVEPGFTLPNLNQWTGSVGTWTEHYDSPISTGFMGVWNPPYILEGNIEGTGAAITPTATMVVPSGKTLGEWAGISVLVAAADCGTATIAEPPPADPGVVVPGAAPDGTVVGLAMGPWNAPADAKGAVDYVTLATPNAGGENSHVTNYLNAGLGVIEVRVGPYGAGVQSINAATWAAAAVAAYAANPTITAIEILNEPGGEWFWGSNAMLQANATAYAALLSATRSAFTAHGSAPLLLASYDGGHPGGTTWGSRMVTGDASVWSYVDGVTVHPYGGTSDPTASALGNRAAVLAAASTTGKPVWITEVGWPTAHAQSATADSLQWTEAQQADNVYGLVEWALGQSVVAGVILFMYEDYGTNAFYGVVRGPSNPDGVQGSHKKSFEDLRRAAHGLVQS